MSNKLKIAIGSIAFVAWAVLLALIILNNDSSSSEEDTKIELPEHVAEDYIVYEARDKDIAIPLDNGFNTLSAVEFDRAAEAVSSLKPSTPFPSGTGVGVIIGESPWGYDWLVAVLIPGDNYIILETWNCDREDALDVLVDPGDAIEWSLQGDDNYVCDDELRILEKNIVGNDPVELKEFQVK